MMQELTEKKQPCGTIAREFGGDEKLLLDPDFSDVVTETADNLAATHATSPESLANGHAAGAAIKGLGCAACVLDGCAVKQRLEAMSAEGELQQQMRMFANGPAWLTAVRVRGTGKPLTYWEGLENDIEATRNALAAGEFDPESLLGGVKNEFAGLYTKTDIPELEHLKNLKPDTQVEAHHITTKSGNTFTVLDVEHALPFKGEPVSVEDYGVLIAKLLNRMSGGSKNGNPQVFSADQIMQKQIKKVGDSWMYELRMNGKNRMYILVKPDTEDNIPRITILGAHGGDERTQRDFIDITAATI